MRNLLILFFITILVSGIHAQNDPQWYILDGKNSLGGSVNTTDFISISGIKNALAKDHDLFLIYDDNSFYNSRDDVRRTRGTFKWKFDNQKNFSFSIPTNKNVTYAYWSNKYDGDDPPNSIKVGNTNSALNEIQNFDSQRAISAIHNIVPDKDFILILDRDKLNHTKTIIPLNILENKEGVYSLINDPLLIPNRNTFNSTFTFPFAAKIINNNLEVDWNITNSRYLYISFRPSDKLLELLKEEVSIVLDHQPDTFHPEDPSFTDFVNIESFRAAHDPNLLTAKCICNYNDSLYLYYRGQFFNDGNETTPNSIRIDFKLPQRLRNLDKKNLKIKNLSYGSNYFDEIYTPIVIDNSGKVVFNLQTESGLLSKDLSKTIEIDSMAQFDLCIGPIGDENIDLESNQHLLYDGGIFFYYRIKENLGIADSLKSDSTLIEVDTEGPFEESYSIQAWQRKPIIQECDICGTPIKEENSWTWFSKWRKENPIIFTGISLLMFIAVAGGIIRARNRRKKEDDD